MAEYPSNSKTRPDNTEEAERVVKKVVTKGSVETRNKSWFSKFLSLIFQGDFATVRKEVYEHIIDPGLRKIASEIIRSGSDMLIYGPDNAPRNSGESSIASRISYRRYSDDDRERGVVRNGSAYDFKDIIFDNRKDAEEVLMRMDEILAEYKVVSVLDFYDLVGVTGRHTDSKYGWMNLNNASIAGTLDGRFEIRLPRALAID